MGHHMVPFLLTGLLICAMAQLLYWFEMGGSGVLLFPFLWAYLQESMVRLLTGSHNVAIQSTVWLACYALVGTALGILARKMSRQSVPRVWAMAIWGWLFCQAIVVLSGWLLFRLGLLQME
jgi:hypothetical protein